MIGMEVNTNRRSPSTRWTMTDSRGGRTVGRAKKKSKNDARKQILSIQIGFLKGWEGFRVLGRLLL